MGMKALYVFGNEHLQEDAMARKVAELLRGKVNIVHCRSPDDLLEADESVIMILDVVKGAEKVMVITDVSRLKTGNMMSLHDFDLGFFLNLMQQLGQGKTIKIIGIPAEGNPERIAKEVERWL